jgi:dihydrolipoamide dehydrogenase
MTEQKYDVVVIGGGPAGYPAAIRAAQLGLKAACVDNWTAADGGRPFGGTCLNVGCIPSKALLESSELYHRAESEFSTHGIEVGGLGLNLGSMLERKLGIVKQLTMGVEALFKSAGVTPFKGHGRLLADHRVEVTTGDQTGILEAEHVVLATGSVPIELGVAKFDGQRIVDSSGALEFTEVPKRLGVIGAGVIGLELGSVWRRLGAKVTGAEAAGAGVGVRYERSGAAEELEVDKLIVCVGRRPYTDGLLADDTGVEVDGKGFIKVDDSCHTTARRVWAVGDVVRGPMLAHKGTEEGVMVAELIAGQTAEVNYDAVPCVIYTAPEVAWVGQSEEQVKESGRDYKVGTFPFSANGRAKAMQQAAGLVKVIADQRYDDILGVHIVGPLAGELIAEAVLAMEFQASAEDVQRTMHAHPTLSEAVHEAALSVDKHAIHAINR